MVLIMEDLYPLRMRPVFKNYLWGGTALKEDYHKRTPYDITAESWEVAVHKDGTSVVDNGPLAGMSLDRVMEKLGEDLMGSFAEGDRFPLMLKILDANDKLSVQVHPDDIYANEHENGELGKTEMWYVLDAKPNAKLIYGFNRDLTEEEFSAAIRQKRLPDILNSVSAKRGDVFFIEAGTVHAVGSGLVIAEIQQNSNTTYRVYDWDRVDKNGKSRELHIAKALDVSNLEDSSTTAKMPVLTIEEGKNVRRMLSCCRYFAAEHITVEESAKEKTNGRSFHIILIADGEGTIGYQGGSVSFRCGDSFLIPAELGKYTINGECEYLKYYIPEFDTDFLAPLLNVGYTEEEVLSLLR